MHPSQAIVEILIPEGRTGVLLAEDGRRVIFRAHVIEGTAFEDLSLGMPVEFAADEHPRNGGNPIAVYVRVAEGSAPVSIEATPRGGSLASEPPPSLDGDEVGQTSWQSFPASDPPALR